MHIFLTGAARYDQRRILEQIRLNDPDASGLHFIEIPESSAQSFHTVREIFSLLAGPDSVLGTIPASDSRLLGILSNRPNVLLLEVSASNLEQTYDAVSEALFPRKDKPDNPPSCGAVVVREHKGQSEILLIRTKHGNWSFPKGRMNTGETEPMTAVREVREETGIAAIINTGLRWDISAMPVNKPGIRNDRRIILFLAKAAGGIAQPQPSEVRELRWVPAAAESAELIEFPPDRHVFLEALDALQPQS